jgi:hypothetical protein
MPSVLDEIGYFIDDFEGKMGKNPPYPLKGELHRSVHKP